MRSNLPEGLLFFFQQIEELKGKHVIRDSPPQHFSLNIQGKTMS